MKNKSILLFCLFSVPYIQTKFEPAAYHKSNDWQFKNSIKELHKLKIIGSENVLDIGSGDGRISSYIAKTYLSNGHLTGIDISKEMVQFAATQTASSNITYEYADAQLYQKQETYDFIISFWTLHWISDYEKVLDNIAISLKVGGKTLLCHTIGESPIEQSIHALLCTKKWKKFKSNFKHFKSPTLLEVAKAINLSVLIIENLEIKNNGEWMPLEVVKENLLSLPLFDFIPKDLRSTFCEEMLQNFILKYPLNEKGEIFNWVPVIVIVLKK